MIGSMFPIMNKAGALLLLLLPIGVSCQRHGTPDGSRPEVLHSMSTDLPLRELLDSLSIPVTTISFRVKKSERTFSVLVGEEVLRTYPCVLGEVPVGDKFHQGDRRTPEGTFTFRSKRVHDQWHKFIWVDYPNAESWKRYRQRRAQGMIPRGVDIGGEIGIHGVPEGMDHWIEAGVDWTWGCIALKNSDVDEIYPLITAGRTEIVIEP